MRTARRCALALLLGLTVALGVPGMARAVEATPVITIDKLLQAGELGYYQPGDPITYRYEVTSNDRFVNVAVTDDTCSQVVPVLSGGFNVGDTIAPFGALNGFAGEKWIYTCTTTAPAWVDPGTASTNTGTVTADSAWPVWADLNPFSDTDTFTLKAVALRKAVFVFWNYITGIADPGADDVEFAVDVKNGGIKVGEEMLTVNDPLYFWFAPGTWTLQEQTPPTGYRIFDNRGTWNVNLSDTWRDNTFINGSDYDLAVEKTAPVFGYGGSAIAYGYAVTNTGPAAVTPVVTDDSCSPVTYVSGDASGDGKIQAGETWKFTCKTTPSWPGVFNAGSPWTLVNTATVVAGEADDLTGTIFGGDVQTANDTDTATLYAFVLRKDVGLYNGGSYPDFSLVDNTSFTIDMFKGATKEATFTVSESSPKYLWLSDGTWTFTEVNVPAKYVPFYPGGTVTFTTGSSYPDFSQLNVTWSGCSHGFWKNTDATWPGGFLRTNRVDTVFPGSAFYDSTTLLDALSLKGGSGVQGAEQILLKQAV